MGQWLMPLVSFHLSIKVLNTLDDDVFVYEKYIILGVTYTSCTTAGGFSEPWCSTATDTNGNHIIGYWGNCGSGCPVSTAASTTTTCSTPCKFPFIYKGVVHNACTYAGGFSPAWCSTATDAYGKHINGNWANCGAGCPVEITTG